MRLPLPVPAYRAGSVFALTPDFLRGAGISLLLLDLDNTLLPYGGGEPDGKLREWAAALRRAGVEPVILSNNRRGHASAFAAKLGVACEERAGKPSPRAVRRLLTERGMDKGACALAGDQIFTDMLCAARAGIVPILVDPIELSNPFRRIRHMLEFPFRSSCHRFVEDRLE